MINQVEIELGTDDAGDCSEPEARLRLTLAWQEGVCPGSTVQQKPTTRCKGEDPMT